jgi:DNA repair protein RadC
MSEQLNRLADELKPRERILRAGSATVASSVDLLAVILKTGAQGCHVVELARRIIVAFGSVENLVMQDLNSLKSGIEKYNKENPKQKIIGVGNVKLLELAAAFELVRRGCLVKKDLRTPILSSQDAVERLRVTIGTNALQEHFFVIPLDARRRPLSEPQVVAKGTVNNVAVHPRDVFSLAVKWNAHSILIAHNHPSGSSQPSPLDFQLTKHLQEASKMMGIPLRDHIVFTDIDYYSFADKGTLEA